MTFQASVPYPFPFRFPFRRQGLRPYPGGRRTYLLFLFSLLVLLFPSTPARGRSRPARSGPAAAARLDAERSKALSRRLGDPVVVYETELFRIIASKTYEQRLLRQVNGNVVRAVADFRSLMGIPPGTPLWKGGEKGRLVLLKDRRTFRYYVQIFKKEAHPETLNPDFTYQVQDAQSFYWIEPWPYAVCCAEGANFEDAVRHLFHLLGHILLTTYEYNYRFAPAWLHEGFGIHCAVAYADGNVLFCTQGLNNCTFGTGVFKGLSAWARSDSWPGFFREPKIVEKLPRLETLARLPLSEYRHEDAAEAWSFVTFLLEEHPAELRAFVEALKAQPRAVGKGSYWPPPEFATACFRKAFGKSMAEMEPLWKAWAAAYHPEGRRRAAGGLKPGEGGAAGPAAVPFDPARDLEGFSDLEARAAEEELAPFRKQAGEPMTPERIAAVRAEWARARAAIQARLEREAAEARAEKTAAGFREALESRLALGPEMYLTREGVDDLLRRAGPPEPFRGAACFLAERAGCAAAAERVRAVLGEHPPEDRAGEASLLEAAGRLESELLAALGRKGGVLKVPFPPGKVRIKGLDQGWVVCRPEGKGSKGAAPAPGPLEGDPTIRVRPAEEGEGVELLVPPARLPLKAILNLAKTKLGRKSEADRLGYMKLCLFRGEEKLFQQEGRFVKEAQAEKAELEALLPAYRAAWPGARVLACLSGDLEPLTPERKAAFKEAWAATAATPLGTILQPRATAVLRSVLKRDMISRNRFLRTFHGFQGFEEGSDRARFFYDFEDPAEIDDFMPLPERFAESLRVKYKVEPGLAAGKFAVEEGRLRCVGSEGLRLRPVFDGETRVEVHFRLVRTDEKETRRFFYTLFGYGLTERGAFVASSSLTHLELQDPGRRFYKMLKVLPQPPILEKGEACVLSLDGGADHIRCRFNGGEEKTFEMDGRRKGRVFLWVYGPWRFEIDRLEVTAPLDPDWVEAAMADTVRVELEALGL